MPCSCGLRSVATISFSSLPSMNCRAMPVTCALTPAPNSHDAPPAAFSPSRRAGESCTWSSPRYSCRCRATSADEAQRRQHIHEAKELRLELLIPHRPFHERAVKTLLAEQRRRLGGIHEREYPLAVFADSPLQVTFRGRAFSLCDRDNELAATAQFRPGRA